MRSSSSSSRISSRSPTPSPSPRRSSPRNTPNIPHSSSMMDDQISTERFFSFIRYLGKHVFVVFLSIIFGIFSGLSSGSLLHFLVRIFLLSLTLYLINFFFYKKGAKVITETFFTAFIVIACTFFIVSCPYDYYVPSLLLMVLCSYLYYRL